MKIPFSKQKIVFDGQKTHLLRGSGENCYSSSHFDLIRLLSGNSYPANSAIPASYPQTGNSYPANSVIPASCPQTGNSYPVNSVIPASFPQTGNSYPINSVIPASYP